jgi:3-deoxy-manno-octulosonate cytidylyltransferase (CMP-KDO synthetase)
VLRFAVPVVSPAGLARSLTSQSISIIAVIPARYQSTRLPGKALAMIHGQTMIERVYRRTRDARTPDAVVVATDDQRIADVVDSFGGTAVMTAADHASGTDRLAEVAARLDAEIVVNVQGDEPLISPDAIDAVVRVLDERRAEMSTLRRRIRADEIDNPALVKVVVDRQGDALLFSRAPTPYARPGVDAPDFWGHLGLYAYRRRFLLALASLPSTPLERAEGLEQLRALEHGHRIATAETTADTIGVDTPDDLERVRRLVEAGALP